MTNSIEFEDLEPGINGVPLLAVREKKVQL